MTDSRSKSTPPQISLTVTPDIAAEIDSESVAASVLFDTDWGDREVVLTVRRSGE